MTSPRVHLAGPLVQGARRPLDAEAAHHARDVLRRHSGDPAIAFDGEGHECDAEFVVEGHEVALVLGSARTSTARSPLTLRLVLGLPKGEKLDWVLEKATELGVSSVYPAATQRSVVKLDEARARSRLERWNRIAAAAARQCERAEVPVVHEVAPLAQQLRHAAEGAQLCLYAQERSTKGATLSAVEVRVVAVLIGPEGGLTPTEQALAESLGYAPWSLGPRILRAETAAIAVAAVLQHALGDLGRG